MRRHLDPDEWADIRGDIFVLYGQLGITTDIERHRLQHALTGCNSLRYMTREEHLKLIQALEQLSAKSLSEQTKTIQGLLTLSSFDYQPQEKGDF